MRKASFSGKFSVGATHFEMIGFLLTLSNCES